MSDHLIARVAADCDLRHPDLGSVVLNVPDARRLLALARRGLEAEPSLSRSEEVALASRVLCDHNMLEEADELQRRAKPEPPHA